MTESNNHPTFGEHLRLLRESASLTLKEVASHIEIDISLLAKIERNERYPTRQHIEKIARYFNTNEKELLDEFLSDQIAYKVIDENADVNVLRVAESKVEYLKKKKNE